MLSEMSPTFLLVKFALPLELAYFTVRTRQAVRAHSKKLAHEIEISFAIFYKELRKMLP